MSEKLFAFFLHLYPPNFRDKYFQESMLLYRDRFKFETGLYRRVRLWCDLFTDLVISLPRAWHSPTPVVAVHSESPRANVQPAFQLLRKESLRPAVILLGAMLSFGSFLFFTFVLKTVFQHPIHPDTMSSVESVMHKLNKQESQEEVIRTLTGERETYLILPRAEVQNLLSGDCTTIHASKELPDSIMNAFATMTHTKPFALADPNANFNSTEMIVPGIPQRRLVLAGRCQDRWFIEYEHGGRAKTVALMVLKANPDQSVTFLWGRQLKTTASDLPQLRTTLANADFWDAPYSW